jgi:hypothetical protein
VNASAYARERTQEQLVGLCHAGLDLAEFFNEAGRLVRRVVAFDGFCSLSLDPATLLPTSHFTHDSMRPEDVPRLAENELLHEDFNKFAELARAEAPARSLSAATDGVLERSARHREILTANGFGDELRVTARDEAAWACFAFYRAEDGPRFVDVDVEFVAGMSAVLAEGVRRGILLAAAPTEEGPDAPGLILLDKSGAIEDVTSAGERWLGEMISPEPAVGGLPQIVNAVAYRTLLAAEGGGEGMARARVPTSTGRWVVLHGSLFADGKVAVIHHRAGAGAGDCALDRGGLRAHRARAGRDAARPPRALDGRDRERAPPLSVHGAGPPQVDLREDGRAQSP